MRISFIKRSFSMFLGTILFLIPIHVSANGTTSYKVLPPITGIRSEMIVTEDENIRTVETTYYGEKQIRAIYNKNSKVMHVYYDGQELKKDPAKINLRKMPPVTSDEVVIGNYGRLSTPYQFSTIDLKQKIVWQGITRYSYVWRITGNDMNLKKDIATTSYDTLPRAFTDMCVAVTALYDQFWSIVEAAAQMGLDAEMILLGYDLTNIGLIEVLLISAGFVNDLKTLLYAKGGLQDRVNTCQTIYDQYGK